MNFFLKPSESDTRGGRLTLHIGFETESVCSLLEVAAVRQPAEAAAEAVAAVAAAAAATMPTT